MATPLKQLLAQLTAGNGRWTAYDPTLAALLGNAQTSLASAHSSYGRGVNRTKVDFGEQRHDLLNERNKAFQENSGLFADRGTLRSGVFAKAQGDLGNEYQKNLVNLNRSRTDALSGLRDTKLSAENAIRQSVMSGQAESAQRAQAARQQAAQDAADAAHQQQMLNLQRQLVEQQKAQAAAAQNAFRGSMGPTGQAPLWTPEEQQYFQIVAFFNKLKAQQQQAESRRNPFGGGHYQ